MGSREAEMLQGSMSIKPSRDWNLGKDTIRNGAEPATMRLLEYDQNGDKKTLKNTPLTTRHTFVGLGT
eukprot:11786849-Ditylum_brightwellii.AAC.1